jgi:hypothetical protein
MIFKLFLTLFILTYSQLLYSEGFWDENFTQGKIRTEFAPNKGTAANPLAITFNGMFPGIEGCQFNAADAFSGCPARAGLPTLPNNNPVWLGTLQQEEACNGNTQLIGDSWVGCTEYQSSPYFAINNPGNNYWVIHANNDPSFDQCNEGPPGLSHQIQTHASNQESLFKVSTEDVIIGGAATRKKLRMGINSSEFDTYCAINNDFQIGDIPFLSVGAQKQRGNVAGIGSLGTINQGGHSLVTFNAQIAAYSPFNCPDAQYPQCIGIEDEDTFGVHAGIYTIINHNNLKYMLFLNLFTSGVYDNNQAPGFGYWNWPIEDSFFYPGAKIAVFTAGPELISSCGIDFPTLSLNDNTSYQIDVTKLYRCAKDLGFFPELPNMALEIEGFHWFIETFGPEGQFELVIEKMKVGADDLIFATNFN